MFRSLLKKTLKKKRTRKKSRPAIVQAARWLGLAGLAAFLAWAVYLPGAAGAAGRAVHLALTRGLGWTAYLVPLIAAYGLLWHFKKEDLQGLLTISSGALLTTVSLAMLFGSAGTFAGTAGWGGLLGDGAAAAAGAAIGRAGAAALALGLSMLGLKILFGVSWSGLLLGAAAVIREDYKGWTASRRELRDMIGAAARKGLPQTEGREGPRIAPIPEPAKTSEPRPAPAAAAPPAQPTIRGPEPAPEPKTKKKAPPPPVKGSGGGGPYSPPPLDLLKGKVPGAPTGRPTDAEIREAVDSLSSALKSFEIDAVVDEISPGPVITRYEVKPGLGVTVSSIVARANDIALATKAKGIRMIAPIPGKAAIGIEIPNRRPATVTLREVLESSAMAEEHAPLAFGLGLASDGRPLSANLGTMPHVLVAGATNSGKSVMVHSLIASILFRQPPDRVKLLLIDPKRIELTLYDDIPHLYDPKTPPEEVAVITTAKKASAALKALVRVMEDRYEKFQAYKARDIEQFNREARKRGDPEEFFIVVVIDELADLMVVARDEVEDSIQRLTQMARAVGIHLVIATQRPSVDVLTGVIKANLPSRIAMRVASKVDSKVIIDGNGAEALQGKGDALYLIPGQDPARIQGAFVSTEEIGKLVEYLKTRGKPAYPLLDTMVGAVGEADLGQFGVEPLEFTQALKLVLERRRVSQDLLKSQFGSSARATNLLSLLEIKGFIQKPEGSNRWNIHFDKIEDYLRQHYPQVKIDKKYNA